MAYQPPNRDQQIADLQPIINLFTLLSGIAFFLSALNSSGTIDYLSAAPDQWPETYGWGLPVGLLLGCAIAWLVPLTCGLHRTLRHLYALHWLVLAGFCFPGMGLLATRSLDGISEQLVLLAVASTGPATFAHLISLVSPMKRGSRMIGLTAAFAASAVLLAGVHTLFSIIPAIAAWKTANKVPAITEDEILPESTKKEAALSYLMFNVVSVVGPGPLIIIFFMTVLGYTGGEDQPVDLWRALMDPGDSPFSTLGIYAGRLVLSLIVPALSCLFIFVWPELKRPEWLPGACVFLAIWSILYVSSAFSLFEIIVASFIAGLAIIPSLQLLAIGERRERWRLYPLALAITCSAMLGTLSIQFEHPVAGLIPWLVDIVILWVLWTVAYFTSILWLRKRLEEQALAK